MQILGPVLALLAFARRPVRPAASCSATPCRRSPKFTPAYGVGVLARAPLTGDAGQLGAIVNIVAWTASSSAARRWLFRRDTARV